jgi:hypothetical protein
MSALIIDNENSNFKLIALYERHKTQIPSPKFQLPNFTLSEAEGHKSII